MKERARGKKPLLIRRKMTRPRQGARPRLVLREAREENKRSQRRRRIQVGRRVGQCLVDPMVRGQQHPVARVKRAKGMATSFSWTC